MTSTAPAAPAPSRAVAAVAVVGALVLLGGVALSARGVATEDLDTVVSAASEGTVLVVAGTERAARRGTAVPDGAQVRTPDGGTAALSTGGRVVQLAPASTVRVLDGARQRLERGSALVEATEGPGVLLSTGSTRVSVRDAAVVRVEDTSPVRVAAYRGGASVGVDRRRARTALPALHQLEVQGRALPSRPTPLRLLPGDPWEREQLATVVDADTDLRRTVAGYQEQGGVVVAALLAREPGLRAGSPVVRAEQALAFALAHEDGTAFVPERYRGLLRDREDGGSWGVVAALNDASPADVDRYTDGLAPGELPGAVQQAAGGPGSAPDLDVLGPLVGLPAADAPAPAADGTDPAPRPRPSSSPGPRPTTTPPPGDPDPLPAPVRDVVDTVLDVLPVDPPAIVTRATPLPTASPTRAPLLDVEVDLPRLR